MRRGRLVKWKRGRVSEKISKSRDLNKYLVWITDVRGILMVVTSLLSNFSTGSPTSEIPLSTARP